MTEDSLLSGLNNLSVNSILDSKYSTYFGFTPNEVKEMAAYYGASEKYNEICDWYNGYRFGNSEIFNPWSVINYLHNGCKPKPFSLSPNDSDIIDRLIDQIDADVCDKLRALSQAKTVVSYVDINSICSHSRKSPASIFSFLLTTGYLKAVKAEPYLGVDYICELALPNKEVSFAYTKEILSKIAHGGSA